MLKIEISKTGKAHIMAKGSRLEVLENITYAVIRMIEQGAFTMDQLVGALVIAKDAAKEAGIELEKEDTDTCQKVS